MNKESTLKKEYLSEKEWHEKNFSISHSHNTKDRGIIALKVFDTWCKEKLEIPDPDVTDLELEYRKKAQGLNGLAKRTVLDELESKIKERYAKIYADAQEYKATPRDHALSSSETRGIVCGDRLCSQSATDDTTNSSASTPIDKHNIID